MTISQAHHRPASRRIGGLSDSLLRLRLVRPTAGLLALSLGLSGCGFLSKPLPGSQIPAPPEPTATGPAPLDWHGAVAADEPVAAEVARSILAAGGNAADAGTALAFTLAVTLPSRASLGGGGACLAVSPGARSAAKSGPGAILFLPRASGGGGSRPSAVPMTARGLLLLQAVYGVKPIDQLIAPAQRLAQLGTPVSDAFAQDLSVVAGPLLADPAARAVFADSAGNPLVSGARMTQPALADTLNHLRVDGVTDLYDGRLAAKLESGSSMAAGPISAADLQEAVPSQTAPLVHSLNGNKVTFLPPPADGGLAADGAFAQLRAQPGDIAGAQSEALALAAAWRAGGGTGDPEALLTARDLPPGQLPQLAASTSFVVVDQWGGAVACALTMNNLFGTGRIAPGTGILLAASPTHAQTPLLSAAIVWNKPLNAVRAAVAASGQEGAPLAVAVATDNALRHGGRDITAEVPEPGRANVIGCPDYVPGSFKSCVWTTDPRGQGLATGRH